MTYDRKDLIHSELDDKGAEINNPQPLNLNIGEEPHESLAEKIKRMVKNELSQASADMGNETFEESNDFDIKDEFETYDDNTQYTLLEEEYDEPRDYKIDNVPTMDEPDKNEKPTENSSGSSPEPTEKETEVTLNKEV